MAAVEKAEALKIGTVKNAEADAEAKFLQGQVQCRAGSTPHRTARGRSPACTQPGARCSQQMLGSPSQPHRWGCCTRLHERPLARQNKFPQIAC